MITHHPMEADRGGGVKRDIIPGTSDSVFFQNEL